MTDFDFDCRQKKIIARGAIHKKNGSKSKKCSLGSDNLSKKEWKKRNGSMSTYNMNDRMTWKVFKKMPADLQNEYLTNLVSKYNANYTALSQAFGVTPWTISEYAKHKGISLGISTGSRMSDMEKSAWEMFLDPSLIKEEENNVEAIEQTSNAENKKEESSQMYMERSSITFHGKLSVEDIANSLRYMLGKDSDGTLTITYSAKYQSCDNELPF